MGCIFSKKKEDKNCECNDCENCKCEDCNNLKCDCNPESNRLTKCQHCEVEMLYKDFIEYYGFCDKCRNLN